MLRVGQEAPDFTLPGVVSGTIDTHGLAEYAENGWAVVVVFYPFDFHPVCTTQMCTLGDSESPSMVGNIVVLGISTDSVYSHRTFGEQHRVDFPLLSDSDGSVARAYGVLVDELDDHREVARSAVFVVDSTQQVQHAWRSETPDDEPDMEAVERATNCHGDECELPDDRS